MAVLVNLITVAVVIGFQNEVSDKVLGFGSHAIVSSSASNTVYENEPIQQDQQFLKEMCALDFVKNVQPVAYKPAILQSRKKSSSTQEIQSVLVKGVDANYDFSFFKNNLKAGRLPQFKTNETSTEIIISKRIAQDLHYHVGDQATAFFVKNQPLKKSFKIVGIFETGMEDFDRKIMLCDIRQLQELNDWGIHSRIRILDTLMNDYVVVKAEVNGGNGNHRFDWGAGYTSYPGFTWYPEKDTIFKLIASDYWMFIDGKGEQTTIPDTAYMKINVRAKTTVNYPIRLNKEGQIYREYLNDTGTKFRIFAPDREVDFELIDGKGSHRQYIGAYEFNFHSWENFDEKLEALALKVDFNYSNENQDLKVSGIKEHQSEIFVWLSFLDINVWIIITLMLVIGVINMGSALLVMILLRTPFIGLMKAIGASNWTIRKIFLYQVGFLILKGMFWGNLIGLGFCFIQDYFEIFKLNPEVYYLTAVPIELSLKSILLINLATLAICLLAMLIPSLVISKILPAKSIKFN